MRERTVQKRRWAGKFSRLEREKKGVILLAKEPGLGAGGRLQIEGDTHRWGGESAQEKLRVKT